MVKCIIHCSDLHIRNATRHEEYAEALDDFIGKCQEIASNYEKEEVRILIAGDILHQKNTISPELFSFTSGFLRILQDIAHVIVLAGNHDLLVNNTSRKDAITSLFETASFENVTFLDYETDFKSGFVYDDNITWAVYSIYDNYAIPQIDVARSDKPDNKVIGLYHGMIIGADLDNGSVVDNGIDGELFYGCDCVMAGDIHKRQSFRRGGVPIVYSGSLIQQTFGETITNHGFVVWDMETMGHRYIDLETSYGLYKIEINDINDIKNDKEVLLNL